MTTIKTHLQELIEQALLDMRREGNLPSDTNPTVVVERTRAAEHGDFSSNIALTLAKAARRKPRDIAGDVIKHLVPSKHVEKVEVAGAGFINFHLTLASLQSIIIHILAQGDIYGRCDEGGNRKIIVEFVSANPTGPLHVGHGRGAAYGASLSNILEACGYDVFREYYVNDHGRQMDILATSVWLRYLELGGVPVSFPDNGYQGDYIYDIARMVRQTHGDELRHSNAEIFENLPADGSAGGDKEIHIDALIKHTKELLGEQGYTYCFDAALDTMVADIRQDLLEFNVVYDNWFSERDLADAGSVARALKRLGEANCLSKRDGAQWFEASKFGDEKDRVVVRDDGRSTYFASDIAYLLNKRERGFDLAIYVLGADHHGYVARLRAAAQGLGEDPDFLEIPLVQFAVLYRDGQKVPMSTRSGQFVTLRELREEVGTDAARFFYIMRSHDQHLDFDLDLAKSQTKENPVYYIQYAHARVASIFNKLTDRGWVHNQAIGEAALACLTDSHEIAVLRALAHFPEAVALAARNRAPHTIAYYLRELARVFHAYYDAADPSVPVLVENEDVRNARLNLSMAVMQTLANGLRLLGVSAPERM